jgi:hypothetical protein
MVRGTSQTERSTQSGCGDGLRLVCGVENAVHGVEAVHLALEAELLAVLGHPARARQDRKRMPYERITPSHHRVPHARFVMRA